ncbi:hypothetical protein CU097_002291, partial [Rhizopus azygosporus]
KLKLNEERTEIKQSSVLDNLFNSVKPQTEKTSSLFNSLDYSIYGGHDQQYRTTPIHPVITPTTAINPVIPTATTTTPPAT